MTALTADAVDTPSAPPERRRRSKLRRRNTLIGWSFILLALLCLLSGLMSTPVLSWLLP